MKFLRLLIAIPLLILTLLPAPALAGCDCWCQATTGAERQRFDVNESECPTFCQQADKAVVGCFLNANTKPCYCQDGDKQYLKENVGEENACRTICGSIRATNGGYQSMASWGSAPTTGRCCLKTSGSGNISCYAQPSEGCESGDDPTACSQQPAFCANVTPIAAPTENDRNRCCVRSTGADQFTCRPRAGNCVAGETEEDCQKINACSAYVYRAPQSSVPEPDPGITPPKIAIDIPGFKVPPTAGLFLAAYIGSLYKYLVGVVAILAVIYIMIGGFIWIVAAGDSGRAKKGKTYIENAIAGLILTVGSYTLLALVNPELVQFRSLAIPPVTARPIDLTNFDPELQTPITPLAPTGRLTISDTRYDDVFQRYADCASVDWNLLKVIAFQESGLNKDLVNKSNYVGLFQTKPANCRSALKGNAIASQCDNLADPEVNTAVGAAMVKSAKRLIDGYCRNSPVSDKLVMIYINHNMGPAVLLEGMRLGCHLEDLKQGALNYYSNNTRGRSTASSYSHQYRQTCLDEGRSEADCTASPKFDYSLKTAQAALNFGVSSIDAPPNGRCPLKL